MLTTSVHIYSDIIVKNEDLYNLQLFIAEAWQNLGRWWDVHTKIARHTNVPKLTEYKSRSY